MAVFSPEEEIRSPPERGTEKRKRKDTPVVHRINWDDLQKTQPDPRLNREPNRDYPPEKFRKIFLHPTVTFWCQARSAVGRGVDHGLSQEKGKLKISRVEDIAGTFFKKEVEKLSDQPVQQFSEQIQNFKKLLVVLYKGVKVRNNFGASYRILEHYKDTVEMIRRQVDHLIALFR